MIRPRWETPVPNGVKGSYGPAVRAWAERELGIVFAGWQRYAIDRVMRYDRNGDLVHRIALLSTGRQNGKSIIVRAIFGWMLDEGWKQPAFEGWSTMLAAAHDAKQARIVYRGVLHDFERHPRLKADTRLTQYFGIEHKGTGLTLDTVSAVPGSARGLSAGLIAWDEMLTQRGFEMWEALSPTQSAQRSPLMLLTSTAGTSESVVLRAFYDRLVRQSSGDEKPDPSFYGAWWQSQSPDAGFDLRELKRANPAIPDGRPTLPALRSEYSILPAGSWQRERLNHWVDDAVADAAFSPGVWGSIRCADPLEAIDGPWALGIGVAPGWNRATVAVAAMRPDGRIGVEVFRDIRDDVTPERVTAAIEAFSVGREPLVIAYDASSGGASEFERHAGESGLVYDGLKPGPMVAATMDVSELVMAGRLAVDDPLFDAQITNVVKRNVGQDGMFRFSRGLSTGPIDAIEAMALAAHAISFQQMPGLW